MKRRTTILVEPDLLEHYERRARRRGTTLSQEIRETLREAAEKEPNPNQWLLHLADAFQQFESAAGPQVDSQEWKKSYARATYRDAMDREPAE